MSDENNDQDTDQTPEGENQPDTGADAQSEGAAADSGSVNGEAKTEDNQDAELVNFIASGRVATPVLLCKVLNRYQLMLKFG